MRRFSFFRIALLVAGIFLVSSGVARADTLGQSVTFFVNPGYDAQDAETISATLRAVGARGYFYVDDRVWAGFSGTQRTQFTADLEALSGQFDEAIYPRETSLWGSEPSPGVDGDVRITILLEQMNSGSGGYFETIHGYSRSLAEESNQREMVFVNAESVTGGTAKNLLAHEFQHLISFNQKELLRRIHEDVWLNESRSEYSITTVGYSVPYEGSALQRRVQSFLRTPSDSLTSWPNTATDYAIASVFVHYLTDRYGPGILAATLRSPDVGVPAINTWLAANGRAERFPDVFSDWMVAALINDRSQGSQYGYVQTGLTSFRVIPENALSLSTTEPRAKTVRVGEFQPYWLRLIMPSGDALPPTLQVSIQGQGGNLWNGSLVGTYANGHRAIYPWAATNGTAVSGIPTTDAGASLASLVFTITQGAEVVNDEPPMQSADVQFSFGTAPVTPTAAPATGLPINGDLIRRSGQNEIYVVWGKYRRYLTPSILALYGFENRPIRDVSDDVFNLYTTSNYIRAEGAAAVYAVWPDETKHWLHITAAQWDASGRDWNSIFTVNDAEVAFYATGADITR